MASASRVSSLKISSRFGQGRFRNAMLSPQAMTVNSRDQNVSRKSPQVRTPDLSDNGDRSAGLFQIEREGFLGFVGLLAARANQVFDCCGSFCTLALFKFGDPIGNRVDHVVGSLAGNLRFVPLAVNALSTFDDFYFFLGHKLTQI